MAPSTRTILRPFDGSLSGAQGLLDVEQEVFGECPYSAEEVQTMLVSGPQRAWLAFAGDTIVGFVIAFRTVGLEAQWWEIDLLGVLPQWRGRRLGTRLIRACTAGTRNLPSFARAYVAADNMASALAFARAGLHPTAETYTLLIFRTEDYGGRAGRPAVLTPGVNVCEVPSPHRADLQFPGTGRVVETDYCSDANDPLPSRGTAPGVPQPLSQPDGRTRLSILQAEENGRPAGYVELIGVQTLLYSGVWVESLQAQGPAIRQALIHEAVVQAVAAGTDEVGAMVPASDRPLGNSLLAAGFRSLGEFRRHTANLPLPGLAKQGAGAP